MINEELFINGARADTGAALGVRLNRQLINPSELNTKDAQYSYAITLPPTQANNAIFGGAIVEETRDKFNRTYAAEYVVNGVRIFVGNFRLSGVSRGGYKGNLYTPVPKTVRDIFGELKLNQNPEYRIDFEDFVEYVNQYNTAAATAPQPAIFPYVLYGVLPKAPLDRNANNYSARTLWDETVRLSIQDLPPSINPLIMLKHIFEAQGYSLGGSAFDDARLTRVYMSYRNADDYVQPWNYGQHAKINISGSWSSRYNKRTAAEELERGVNQGNDESGPVYAADLLNATNTALNVIQDTGGNVLYNEVVDANGRTWVNAQIRIPTAGFYKVVFGASVKVQDVDNWRATDAVTGVQHIGGTTSNANNYLLDNMYEVRLCRDRKTSDFGLNGPRLNGLFYYNNLPQNKTFDADNAPKYFPQVTADGQVNFVDLAQDPAHLLGFNFGKGGDDFQNPRDTTPVLAQVLAAKPAVSWDATVDADNPTRLAIKSSGYWKFGRIGTFDNPDDNPNIDLDYSAGPFATGKILDANGNPQTPAGGNLDVRISGYALSLLTGFQTPTLGWAVTDFIDLADYDELTFAVVIEGPADDIAIVAYYDINLQYIGFGVQGPASGTDTYTNEPITPPADAAYVRLSGPDIVAPSSNLFNPNTVTVGDLIGDPHASYNTSAFIPVSPSTLYSGMNLNGSLIWRRAATYDAGFNLITYYSSPLNDLTTESNAAYIKVAVGNSTYDAAYTMAGMGVFLGGSPTWEAWTPLSPLYISPILATAGNIILHRFQLARFYTYRITTDPSDNYTGYAYVHNGAGTGYVMRIDFINGEAEFSTTMAPLAVFDPKLTLYLKTPNYDVDGTLVISRRIEGGSEDVIDWEVTDKYKIDLNNAPVNYAKRGFFDGVAASANWNGQGESAAVVWFDAGELLTVASVSSEGRYRRDGMHSTFGWVSHEVKFNLSIQPFRVDRDWLKVSLSGNGLEAMDWNDPVNFDTDSINLVGFLNADMKTDDFIDNFCKAFNLRLTQITPTSFALDVKQTKTAVSNQYVDLDRLASVRDRNNAPLGLPSFYKIGFTVDPEEEGYVVSGDDGGGQFDTGAVEGGVVEQKSAFSYNWFKNITKEEAGGDVVLPLPVISKADVWGSMSYPEAMRKRYTDLASRFWYYDGILAGTFIFNGEALQLAKVSNEIAGLSILNYKNRPFTILENFFTVLVNGASHYTEVEGYLTAADYQTLDGSRLAMFNGDLYYAAELGGYDPTGRNKTNIKLIRKI